MRCRGWFMHRISMRGFDAAKADLAVSCAGARHLAISKTTGGVVGSDQLTMWRRFSPWRRQAARRSRSGQCQASSPASAARPKTRRQTPRPGRSKACQAARPGRRRQVSAPGNRKARKPLSQGPTGSESTSARRNRGKRLILSGNRDNRREERGDNGRAQQGREIGIDVLDTDFGENRGQRGETRRQQRPERPGVEPKSSS